MKTQPLFRNIPFFPVWLLSVEDGLSPWILLYSTHQLLWSQQGPLGATATQLIIKCHQYLHRSKANITPLKYRSSWLLWRTCHPLALPRERKTSQPCSPQNLNTDTSFWWRQSEGVTLALPLPASQRHLRFRMWKCKTWLRGQVYKLIHLPKECRDAGRNRKSWKKTPWGTG